MQVLIITHAGISPVHTSDNVAKNGDIVAETGDIVAKNRDNVAETGDNVAETSNIVFLATMLPDCCRFRRQCRLCGRDYGDNVAGFGDIVAGVERTIAAGVGIGRSVASSVCPRYKNWV